MNRRLLLTLLTALLIPAVALAAIAAPLRNPLEATTERRVERFAVDGRDALDDIVEAGFDVAHDVDRVPSGWEADIVVGDADIAALTGMGAVLLAEDEAFSWEAIQAPMQAAAADFVSAPVALDEVTVGRVDHYTTKGQGFLSVEAKTSVEDESVGMVVTWADENGVHGGAQLMTAFVDSGEYMYHRVSTTVEIVPATVTVTSLLGGEATAPAQGWLYPVDGLLEQEGYQAGFIDGYRDPTQLFDRIEELAAQHPDVAEIVPLEHETNGYQRKAQAVIGSGDTAMVVNSVAWGHEGGNDITVELLAGSADEITVTEDGSAVTVTAPAGADVGSLIEAVNGESTLVTAHTYRGAGGDGAFAPTTSPVSLTDNLSAPVERGPFQTRAIRIGRHRDGSKPGVLIIAQDHAREWVPPLVALEAVERLLANYDTDPATADILDNVDIWVVPSNNPDGSHYSMYDFDLQRKNMTNHCGPEQSDPGYRDQWGVDLNRGYSVASRQDGFAGASGSCTASTYSGPDELSEPEARNIVSLVEANDNIRFFMTIHSNGGQLFWQPGAYIADGRQTPTRPPLGDELFYWQMAERILSHVKVYQDTVVRPDSVGGSSDVLYSSAGNVREELYVNHGVYAMGWEVGGAVWDPATRTWSSGSFQPSWEQARNEYMEYASGVIEMFRIAADYGRDDQAPTAELVADGEGFVFELSEPAHIYYTLDGSEPTEDSARYAASGIREPGEVLQVEDSATVRWLTVDPAGNSSTDQATVG